MYLVCIVNLSIFITNNYLEISRSLIFVDEVGVSFEGTKTKGHGWSLIGTKAIKNVSNFGARINSIVALDKTGIIAASTITSKRKNGKTTGVNATNFANFLNTLAEKLQKNKDYLIVLDNPSIHTAAELEPTWASLKEKNIDKMFLPPFSPFLNPIEYAFNTMKKKLSTVELSSDNLASEIAKQLRSVDENEATGYIRKSKQYYGDCTKMMNFRGNPIFPEAFD